MQLATIMPFLRSSSGSNESNIRLSEQEKDDIKIRGRALENKLVMIGKDNFVKQHEEARKEEIGIYSAAQYCVADFNPSRDARFGSPAERYDYLLHKARKYQSGSTIDIFTDKKSKEYDEKVKKLKMKIIDISQKLEETKKNLADLLKDKKTTVKNETIISMNNKLAVLENFFKESQDISERHKEVKEKLESGELP